MCVDSAQPLTYSEVYTAGRPRPSHIQLAQPRSSRLKQMEMKSSSNELPRMNNITLTCPLEQNKPAACKCGHDRGGAAFEIGESVFVCKCMCMCRVRGKIGDWVILIVWPKLYNLSHTFFQITSKLHKRFPSAKPKSASAHIWPTDWCSFSLSFYTIRHLPVLTDTHYDTHTHTDTLCQESCLPEDERLG